MHPHSEKISSKVLVAILFGMVLFVFALWKSPTLQPKTDQYTISTSSHKNAPTQTLAQARAILQLTPATTTPSSNSTDALTKKIIGAYLQAKQNGTYNKDALDTVIAHATKSQFAEYSISTSTIGKITTVTDSAKNQKIYKNQLNTTLTPLKTIGEYELTTYARAVSTKDDTAYKKLATDATVYRDIAHSLLTMNVPKSARIAHRAVITSFLAFAQTLDVLSKSEPDPMRGLIALRNFMKEEDAIRSAYNQIDTYFILNTYTS